MIGRTVFVRLASQASQRGEKAIPPTVLVTTRFNDFVRDLLDRDFATQSLPSPEDADELLAKIGPGIRAIAGNFADAALMERLPALEIVAGGGAGYDSIDVDYARARGIRVTHTPDVLSHAVAELAIGLMVGLARRIPQADRFIRAGQWRNGKFPLAAELYGKRAGILGLGRIGKEIAARCRAMGMQIAYHGRNRQEDQPYRYYADLGAMAADVDWLVAAVPGGPGTEGLVTRKVLEALGPSGAFVNLGRGGLVDEACLLDLLESGGLGGAALDVFRDEPEIDPRFFALDTVVLSPHQGSATRETRERMGVLMIDNLKAHFAGKPLLTPVI